MPSPKQIEASRRNAQKSTGPRTRQGKARFSMNALKHGLMSRQVLLPDEDKKDREVFGEEVNAIHVSLLPC